MYACAKQSVFYLDKVFGPSCPQDTTTAISQSVPSILRYFTTVGVGTGIDNQLKYQRIYLVEDIPNRQFATLEKLHTVCVRATKDDGHCACS